MFQYPQRIDGGFKLPEVIAARTFNLRFSILSGSMVGSSGCLLPGASFAGEFQYPQRIDGGFKQDIFRG